MTRTDAKSSDLAWYVRKRRINSQGYDVNRSYWGTGLPLYECFNSKEYVTFRADDRAHAIEQLRDHINGFGEVHLWKE